MATGTRNLDAEGLGSLRDAIDLPEGVDPRETILPMRKTDDELADMAERLGLNDPNKNKFLRKDVGSQVATRNKEGVMSFDNSDEIATPFQDAETTFRKLREQGQDELALKLEAAMMKGPLSNTGDLPAKRATAREFLTEALKVR